MKYKRLRTGGILVGRRGPIVSFVGLTVVFLCATAQSVHAIEPVKLLRPSTRLVAVWETEKTPAAKWLHGEKNPFKATFAQFGPWAARFGLDPARQVQTVWLGLTEDYPRGTLLVLQGKFDPTGIDQKLRELSKNLRVVSGHAREGDVTLAAIEVPPAAAPVPGFPESLHIAVLSTETILVAFDRETLTDAVKRAAGSVEGTSSPVESHLKYWDAAAPMRAVAAWPGSLNDAAAPLAGCQYSTLAMNLSEPFTFRLTFACVDESTAATLADRVNGLVAQVRELFPLLAARQELDPQLSRFVAAAANAAVIERTGASVTARVELSAAAVK